MESGSYSNEAIEKSPSQESTARFQTMKRDVESLEDFEEITKDEPSFTDLTSQFLHFETNNKSDVSLTDESDYQQAQVDLPFEDKDRVPLVSTCQEGLTLEPEKLPSETEVFKEANWASSGVDFRDSNCLLSFEDSYSQAKSDTTVNSDQSSGKLSANASSENKLNPDDNSELSFLLEKGESSPVSHSNSEKILPKKSFGDHRSDELSESLSTTQQLPKFKSEPELIREQEVEGRQGDGLHVRHYSEGEASDDDVAPEPIPKDYPEIGVIEGKHFLAALGLDTWFHKQLLNPKVESLIYWRDPKKSGIVFGSVLVILLSLTAFSLISVLAHTALIALVAALAFRIYKSVLQAVQKTSDGHPFKAYLDAVVNHPIITTVFFTMEEYLDIDLTINPEKAREVSDVVIAQVNKILTKCRSLFLVEDVIDSVKFAILLWCLTYVGAWFNGLSLVIISFVGLFTLPKVYENNQAQIDANIEIVKNKINDVSEKIRAVIPLGKKPEEIKDKGE